MYSEITQYMKTHFENTINADPIQVDYFGNLTMVNFRKPALLIEPRRDQKAAKNTRWKSSEWQIRLWVMTEVFRDYLQSMQLIERVIGAEDLDNQTEVGLLASLDQLKYDPDFQNLSGTFGGKQWRILGVNALEYSDVNWGISQRSDATLNTAQVEVTVHFEQER